MGPVKDDPQNTGSTFPAGAEQGSNESQMLDTSRSVELATLSDIARIMSRAVSFDEKASQVVERLAQVSEADWVGLRIPDERLLALRLVASAGYATQRSPLPALMAYNQGMSGRAFQSARTIVSQDYPNHSDAVQYHVEAGERSTLALPMVFNGRVTGVFMFGSKEPGHFTPGRVGLLESVTYQLAPLLENAKLQDELAVTDEIARIITSTLDIDDVFDHFAAAMKDLVNFDRASIITIDSEAVTCTTRYVHGVDVPERRAGSTHLLEGSWTQHVLTSGTTIVRTDISQGRRQAFLDGIDERLGFKTSISIPLVNAGNALGMLGIQSRTSNAFGSREQAILERLANQIAPAVANAQLHAQTRQAEEAERQRSEELGCLLEVARILNHSVSFESKVSRVMEELARICDAGSAAFRVPVKEGLRRIGSAGDQPVDTDVTPYEGNIPALVFDRKELLVVNDYPSHPQAAADRVRMGIRSLLAAPIVSQEIVVGVVIVNSYETGHFTPERVSLVLGIINGLGSLLENARLEDERKRTEESMQETARLASIGELAAGVAHEINNPLTSVLGYSEMLMRSDIPEQHRKDIQAISDEAQRAAKIVKNLLFFARKSGTEKRYTDFNSIVNRALEMKSYDFKVNNISVTARLAPEMPKTMIDEHQLVQVFLNILTNAEQVIHQTTGKGHIDFCTVVSGDSIEITIEDDGPGMPPEELSRIFEPFFTTKEVGQGTGLGLSISYGIIKQHGGDIRAESVEGDGTTFYITIPVVVPEEETGLQITPSLAADRSTKHLLVVDDEPHIRDLLRKYLEMERYTVDLACDGQEAWRKLTSMDYNCIILDLKMPGMSGPELYQLMPDINETLAGKVVFISGDTVSPDTREFVSQTGNPLITKPFSLDEMLKTVQEVCDRTPAAP